MENAVNAITTVITAETLWTTVGNIMPVVAILLPFALGLYFVRRAIKKGAKGKAGI